MSHEEGARGVWKKKDNISRKRGGSDTSNRMTDRANKEFRLKRGKDKGGISPSDRERVVLGTKQAVSRLKGIVNGGWVDGDREGGSKAVGCKRKGCGDRGGETRGGRPIFIGEKGSRVNLGQGVAMEERRQIKEKITEGVLREAKGV